MSFSQLPAVKKDTENGAPGKFFGPSYFETALVCTLVITIDWAQKAYDKRVLYEPSFDINAT